MRLEVIRWTRNSAGEYDRVPDDFAEFDEVKDAEKFSDRCLYPANPKRSAGFVRIDITSADGSFRKGYQTRKLSDAIKIVEAGIADNLLNNRPDLPAEYRLVPMPRPLTIAEKIALKTEPNVKSTEEFIAALNSTGQLASDGTVLPFNAAGKTAKRYPKATLAFKRAYTDLNQTKDVFVFNQRWVVRPQPVTILEDSPEVADEVAESEPEQTVGAEGKTNLGPRRKPRTYKNCRYCGKRFLAKRASQVFDRPACRKRHFRES